MKKYNIIYADPAWSYSGQLFNRGGVKNKYETLHQRKIEELNVTAISHTDSVCFMWATFPKLEEALYIMRAWGFRYITVAFTWIKVYEKSGKIFFGMGKWTRANAEICILGTKGNINRIDASVPQVILSPIREHSEKPEEVKERIVKLMGDLPRIELFARKKTNGWDAWGNGVESDIEIPFMNLMRDSED
jgi:site-specific DNA-methyltransferase (adenine-specific)